MSRYSPFCCPSKEFKICTALNVLSRLVAGTQKCSWQHLYSWRSALSICENYPLPDSLGSPSPPPGQEEGGTRLQLSTLNPACLVFTFDIDKRPSGPPTSSKAPKAISVMTVVNKASKYLRERQNFAHKKKRFYPDIWLGHFQFPSRAPLVIPIHLAEGNEHKFQ